MDNCKADNYCVDNSSPTQCINVDNSATFVGVEIGTRKCTLVSSSGSLGKGVLYCKPDYCINATANPSYCVPLSQSTGYRAKSSSYICQDSGVANMIECA